MSADSQSIANAKRTNLPFVSKALIPGFGGLTPKQDLFIRNLTGANGPELAGNGSKSAFNAGYGSTLEIAATRASQLLRTRKIQDEIRRRLGTAVCSGPEVLEILSKHARADLTDVLTKDGDFSLSQARRRRILKKLKVKTRTDKDGAVTVEKEYEIHDPQAAAEKLGRFHQLWNESPITINVETNVERNELTVILAGALSSALDLPSVIDAESVNAGDSGT